MSDDVHPIAPGGSLPDAPDLPPLMRDWLAGDGPLGSAAESWRACLAAPAPDGPAPAWSDDAWREAWWTDFAADLPDAVATERCRANVAALTAGEADVIVTGQQPGFLGGPLYTLYKAATCIAAAEARSEAGRPTVPLFWSGDDDDDLREAFAPRLYDPRRGSLLRAVPPAAPPGTSVGALPAASAGAGEAAWLAEQAAHNGLAGDLARIWTEARAAGTTWARTQRRALLRLFGGRGLLVVSGDDPRLHAVACPLYARMLADTGALAHAATERGERLAADGYHAQIGDASLANPFSISTDGRRQRLGAADAPPDDPSALRPGVLLRSPVQDWLFRPAGVVAGPAEVAYLKQTEPVYAALDLPRPPLLPRLFCDLRDAALGAAGQDIVLGEAMDEALATVETTAADALHAALRDLFRLAPDEARALAAPNLERWSAANRGLFERLARPRATQSKRPAWHAPGKGRQERALTTHWAAALWGDSLVSAAQAAARAHQDAGAAGDWTEWRILVDSGKDGS